jgi:hypothetical protein
MLYFSVKKGIFHSHRDLNLVSSSTDKTNLLGPMSSTLRKTCQKTLSSCTQATTSSCLKLFVDLFVVLFSFNDGMYFRRKGQSPGVQMIS